MDTKAEEQQHINLDAIRHHKERMVRAQSMESIARSSHMVIAGENGKDLIRYFSDIE